MKEWKLVAEKKVYDGYRKVFRRTFEMPDGKRHDFDVLKSEHGAVAVLALTDDDQVVCYRTFRPGPQAVLLELPGGAVDNPDDLQAEAGRELLEETGFKAGLEYVGSYQRDAYVDGRWHMFVGIGARKVAEPQLDDEENGEVVLVSLADFKQRMLEGNMTDLAAAYAGLHHLGRL